MKIQYLSSFLLLSACGASEVASSYTSSNNVNYYLNDAMWESVDIQTQEDFFLTNMSNVEGYDLYKIQPLMRSVLVHISEDPIPCPVTPGNPKGLCNGLGGALYPQVLYVRDMGCPFNSATTHEMAHYLQWTLYGVNDLNHEDRRIWDIADKPFKACIP